MGHRPTAICAGEEDASDAVRGQEELLLEPANDHLVADGCGCGEKLTISPGKDALESGSHEQEMGVESPELGFQAT